MITETMHRMWVQGLVTLMLARLGSRDWGLVRDVVVQLKSKNLTDLQKRAFAVDQLRDMGVTLPGSIMNLAIEAALVWASSKNGKR